LATAAAVQRAPWTSRPLPRGPARVETSRPMVDWTSPRIVATRVMQMLDPNVGTYYFKGAYV
jgi:hypothetical protein